MFMGTKAWNVACIRLWEFVLLSMGSTQLAAIQYDVFLTEKYFIYLKIHISKNWQTPQLSTYI